MRMFVSDWQTEKWLCLIRGF